jgi:hypothetical protein
MTDAARISLHTRWRRAGTVLRRDDGGGWGSAVVGDPCVVRDDEAGVWRMFLFALPPGHGQAVCAGDPLDPSAWQFAGPLTFTNPDNLAGDGAFKPFVVLDASAPGRAARIGGRHALLVVTDSRAKVVQRAWSASLAGPWTLEPGVLIGRGNGADFDAQHVDAVSAYHFSERGEVLYFYMGTPLHPQPCALSPYGSSQGAAVERVAGRARDGGEAEHAPAVRKLGPILRPSGRAGHWAAGWVGGLQLLPGREHRWVAVVNASPTAPDPADTSLWREEPPPSLGGFAWCDEEWPVEGWRWADEPFERIEDVPAGARARGEGTNLWRHYALAAGARIGLFYNSGEYFAEQLYLKVAASKSGE